MASGLKTSVGDEETVCELCRERERESVVERGGRQVGVCAACVDDKGGSLAIDGVVLPPCPAAFADGRRNLALETWFHGKVTRQQAELVLRTAPVGSYLVRTSPTTVGDFVLSLVTEKRENFAAKVDHYEIKRMVTDEATGHCKYNCNSVLCFSVAEGLDHLSKLRPYAFLAVDARPLYEAEELHRLKSGMLLIDVELREYRAEIAEARAAAAPPPSAEAE
jgi:hypothetical protein